MCKYKVHKLHQRYILKILSRREQRPYHFPVHFGFDVPGKCEEGVVHVNGCFGAGLHELDAVLDGQLVMEEGSPSGASATMMIIIIK